MRRPRAAPRQRIDQAEVVEAAAVRYDPNEHAPRMVAHGRGDTARRIMELAEQHDLPIRRDPTLVAILGALDIGAEVPADLYGVIAEVLAWAYHADQAAGSARTQRRAA